MFEYAPCIRLHKCVYVCININIYMYVCMYRCLYVELDLPGMAGCHGILARWISCKGFASNPHLEKMFGMSG